MTNKRKAVLCRMLSLAGFLFSAGSALADRFEENNPAVMLNGAWMLQTDTRASGGGYAVSNTAGDTVTFSFTGDSIALYRRIDVDGGDVMVSIDGNNVGAFHFYFQEQRWQIAAVLDHLGNAKHTIILTVVGQMPQGSTGSNVYFDAFEVPAPFAPTADQQKARDRVNSYRTKLGVPAASLSLPLDLAAQAHADYNAMTGVLGHDETFGTPGFVGAQFGDRSSYFGYDAASSEDAHQLGDAIMAVDGWVTSVYHRVPIAAWLNTDIGYGLSRLNNKTMDVLDFGTKSSTAPAARVISTYPANNQVDVVNSWAGGEGPDPLCAVTAQGLCDKGDPMNPPVTPVKATPVGYPISLHIAQPANPTAGMDMVPNSATLTGPNNLVVPIYYYDKKTDPNQFLDGDTFFMIPQQPLAISTAYTAHITGTDSTGNKFDVTWTFTTVPAAAISGVQVSFITASDAWVFWYTAGAVTSNRVEYGLTTAYGQSLSGAPNGNGAQIAAHLVGLTAATTYHYHVVAADAQGNTRTSDDLTFTTAAQ